MVNFKEVIELPESTDSQHIQARFDNGLLAITYGRTYRQEESILYSIAYISVIH